MLQEGGGVERHSGRERGRLGGRLALALIAQQRVQSMALVGGHLTLHGAARGRDEGRGTRRAG